MNINTKISSEELRTLKSRIKILKKKIKRKDAELDSLQQVIQDNENLIMKLKIDDDIKTNALKQQDEHKNIFEVEAEHYRENMVSKNENIEKLQKVIAQQMRRELCYLQDIKHLKMIIDERTQSSNFENYALNNIVVHNNHILNPELPIIHNRQYISHITAMNSTNIMVAENIRDWSDSRRISDVYSKSQCERITDRLKNNISIAFMNLQNSCGKLVEEAIALRNAITQLATGTVFDTRMHESQGIAYQNIEMRYPESEPLVVELIQTDLQLQFICSEVARIRENVFAKNMERHGQNV